MQTTELKETRVQPSTPRWVWWTLLVGSVLLFGWGLFVLSFKSEPSAVGRTGALLIVIGGASIGTALVGGIAAIGLLRRARWASSLAWLASVLMVLTCISSWAGIVGIVGLVSGRMLPRT